MNPNRQSMNQSHSKGAAMSKHYLTAFNTRQYMQTRDFEIFYYEDKVLAPVSMHQHDFYEVYFFLSGHADIHLGGTEYPLSHGNICLIIPGARDARCLLLYALCRLKYPYMLLRQQFDSLNQPLEITV